MSHSQAPRAVSSTASTTLMICAYGRTPNVMTNPHGTGARLAPVRHTMVLFAFLHARLSASAAAPSTLLTAAAAAPGQQRSSDCLAMVQKSSSLA
ncbi:hypothetical protein ACHAWF_018111 [Thalassiosira exigua]